VEEGKKTSTVIPANRMRRRKGESSSLRWDSNVWFRVLRDSDHWQIALQITDPSSRQRRRPRAKSKAIFRQKKEKSKIWLWAPKGCPTPRYTDWLTVSRKVTSTSTSVRSYCSRTFTITPYCVCTCQYTTDAIYPFVSSLLILSLQTVLGEEIELWSPSICSFLHTSANH
jgi:hypothetical protein